MERYYINIDLNFTTLVGISKEFLEMGVEDQQIVKLQTLNIKRIIDQLLKELEETDQLVAYDYESLKLTIAEFRQLNELLVEKNKKLVFLKGNPSFLSNLEELVEIEKRVLSERIKKAYEMKPKNMAWGRPKIDEDTQEKIRDLYFNQKKTVRAVAKDCDVSIGTVSKYIQKYSEEFDKD